MRKKFFSFFLCLLVLLITPSSMKAQITINEVLNNPSGTEAGAEWIELYNPAEAPLSLKDCILFLDDSADTQKILFDEEEFVDKYKVITWDKSWLNNTGDTVSIKCRDYEEVIKYGDIEGSVVEAPPEGVSFGRISEIGNQFGILSSVTLGSPNSKMFTPSFTPTVTQKPLPTTKPTSTPMPSPTTKPEPTTKPSSSPAIALKPSALVSRASDTPIYSATEPAQNREFLTAEISNTKETRPTNSEKNGESKVLGAKTEKNFPVLAIIFVIVGLTIIVASVSPFIKVFRKPRA